MPRRQPEPTPPPSFQQVRPLIITVIVVAALTIIACVTVSRVVEYWDHAQMIQLEREKLAHYAIQPKAPPSGWRSW